MTRLHIHRLTRLITLALILGVLSSAAMATQSLAQVDPDSPAAISHHAAAMSLFEIIFNGDDAPEALLAADAVIDTPAGQFTGPAGLSDYLRIIHQEYPDATFRVTSTAEHGDSVHMRWTMTATRFMVGPREAPVMADIRLYGETTITFDDGQIATMTLTDATTGGAPADDDIASTRLDW
jgi:hypothetical protein